jgi:hypothetical protein
MCYLEFQIKTKPTNDFNRKQSKSKLGTLTPTKTVNNIIFNNSFLKLGLKNQDVQEPQTKKRKNIEKTG